MKAPLAYNPSGIRPPAVAGRFYPDRPDELRRMVAEFLCRTKPQAATPKAVIAPHAGYIFSGPVAASAHAQFMPDRNVIRRIVLMGPSHHVMFDGLAASNAEFFATPLGLVPVDTDVIRELVALPRVAILDEAHTSEHSLEVQLPFLQIVLNEFKIVPLLTGSISDEAVAEIIATLWDGAETRFVISSDLSHYYNYTRAQKLDSATSRAVEHLRPEQIMPEQACGRTPLCGLLRSAQQHGLHAHTVDLRNSGDIGGPRNEVVGYGAFVFEEYGRQSQGNFEMRKPVTG